MNCSKRCWDGMIRSWRRKLHEYDPPSHASPGEPSDLADVSCSIASPASDGVGPLLVSSGLGDADCSPDSKTQTPNSVKSVLDGSSCDYSPRAIRKTRPRSRSDEMHLRSSQLADDSLAGVAALNLEELCNDSDLWLPPSPTPKPRGHCCCADHPSGDLSPTPRPTPVNAARCRSPFMGSDLASCPPLALPSPDSHRASPSATFMTRADNDADTIALAHAETLHLAASADAADASGDAVDFRSYVDQYVQSFSPSKLLKKRSSSMDIEDGPEMAQSPRASLPEPPSETRAHDASEIPNELVDRTRNVFLTNGIVQDLESFDSVVQQFVRDADDSASDYIRDGRQGPSPKSHTSATVATSDTCKVVAGPSSTGPSLHSFSTTAPGYTRHNSMPLPDDVSPSATVASSAYFKSQKTAVREARSLTVDHSASDEAVEGVDVFWR
ncbi:uncharacterized protein BJ171DRAFT_110409 [Polychytrium aggregatum]|uniref:uncharacterized protein n=1 Tax=Polychytrium aggregatum TaxID=110093 RepID=UPI0022FDDC05|nr:uncharacterized protein BJ171DRAFT_110409 [Polychytrium aggregatum]KAI9209170.1 hypothetical protein BJ171DRAFT_110409 [Polychytrium aggregatum]